MEISENEKRISWYDVSLKCSKNALFKIAEKQLYLLTENFQEEMDFSEIIGCELEISKKQSALGKIGATIAFSALFGFIAMVMSTDVESIFANIYNTSWAILGAIIGSQVAPVVRTTELATVHLYVNDINLPHRVLEFGHDLANANLFKATIKAVCASK